jgi:hypothetical protein
LQVIETQDLEEESYPVLEPFRKPVGDPILTAEAKADLDYLLAREEEASSISSIELKFHQVEGLDHHIADSFGLHSETPAAIGSSVAVIKCVELLILLRIVPTQDLDMTYGRQTS